MDAVERELARRGVDRLTLAVVYGNEGALRFCARGAVFRRSPTCWSAASPLRPERNVHR